MLQFEIGRDQPNLSGSVEFKNAKVFSTSLASPALVDMTQNVTVDLVYLRDIIYFHLEN